MYEIWLVMNIAWEIALAAWPLLVLCSLLWAVLMGVALRSPRARWRAALPLALGAGLAVAVLAVLAIPPATQSSLAEMGYWVDWANLGAIALGCGAVALAFVWPLAALQRAAL